MEEFAQLDRELDNWKPKEYRRAKLRQIILGWYPELAAEEEITVPGQTCDVVISGRDRLRSVTPAGKKKLFQLWGPKEFISRAVILLKALDDPQDVEGLYTVEALTGPRHLHVVTKPAVVKGLKAAPAA